MAQFDRLDKQPDYNPEMTPEENQEMQRAGYDTRFDRDGDEFGEYAGATTGSLADTGALSASAILLTMGGIWLAIAPFVLNYSNNSSAVWNDVIFGVGIAAVAMISQLTRSPGLSWAMIVAGIWLIIAPFALNYSDATPVWNDIIMGVLTIVLGFWRMSERDRADDIDA